MQVESITVQKKEQENANKTSRAKDLKDCYCHLQNSIFLIYLCKKRMEPSLRTQVVHSVTLPTGKVQSYSEYRFEDPYALPNSKQHSQYYISRLKLHDYRHYSLCLFFFFLEFSLLLSVRTHSQTFLCHPTYPFSYSSNDVDDKQREGGTEFVLRIPFLKNGSFRLYYSQQQ